MQATRPPRIPPYDLIFDRETYDCAFQLVDDLGPTALYEALNRVEAAETSGQDDQAHYWRRIEAAVNVLLNDERRGAMH
ncbi:MAG: hypothetical protein AAF607_08395 [Pseudomonadota bacterium]